MGFFIVVQQFSMRNKIGSRKHFCVGDVYNKLILDDYPFAVKELDQKVRYLEVNGYIRPLDNIIEFVTSCLTRGTHV